MPTTQDTQAAGAATLIDYPDMDGEAVPAIGSFWTHSNGDTYQVTGYADMFSKSHQKTPPRIIYRSSTTGRVWSRVLSDWYRAMKPAAALASAATSAPDSAAPSSLSAHKAWTHVWTALCDVPCECSFKRREEGNHLSGCYLFDLNIALQDAAALATPAQAPAIQAPEAVKVDAEEIEAVIACLGDDAASLRADNSEDERADNMERAAELLEALTPPAQAPAIQAPLVRVGALWATVDPATGVLLRADKPAIQAPEAVAWSTGITWGDRQSEMVVKLTKHAQPEHGFIHPLLATIYDMGLEDGYNHEAAYAEQRKATALNGYSARQIKQMLATPSAAVSAEPVARTCSDERMCINCFSDKGSCLGPYRPAKNMRLSDAQIIATLPKPWHVEYDEVGREEVNCYSPAQVVAAVRAALATPSAAVSAAGPRAPEYVAPYLGPVHAPSGKVELYPTQYRAALLEWHRRGWDAAIKAAAPTQPQQGTAVDYEFLDGSED